MENTQQVTGRPAGSAVRPAGPRDPRAVPPPAELAFPGCTPRRLRRRDLETYDGRLEYWDARTETVWVCEPTTPYHEEPSATLAATLRTIAEVRGSPIKCYGTMDLMLRDSSGEPRGIMQADQSVYLCPLRAVLPGRKAMVIGEHDFPDVVLEVDHTTDARRGKLKLYEAWGFPEVWIQVPDRPSESRPRNRLPGLTVHVLVDGAYRVSEASRAFPGWTAVEIHAALDETAPSVATVAVLERVGATLGAREGTGPDDDPLLRSQRRQGLEQGRKQGLAEQRALLCQLARRKFGAAVGDELALRLNGIDDPSRLVRVGTDIIDCADGAALLGRIS